MGSDIGMVGLSVMGSNLALNMASKGFKVSAYDAFSEFTDKFVAGAGANNSSITAYWDLKEFLDSLNKPRRVFMMIKAGSAVDEMINKIVPLLDEGDIIIDGGNSKYTDTTRRTGELKSKGIRYIGTGVSGGEEGALKGPSMMPGGSYEAWPYVKDIFTSICAHLDNGEPCCGWVGEDGAGHFVKMVHNGIEYGDMQLICECYQFMRDYLKMTNEEISEVFEKWNKGDLESYLIEITSKIVKHKEDDGRYTIDIILDSAGQKGTGMWTSVTSLEEGIPLTLISEAVFARCLSSLKAERVLADKLYSDVKPVLSDVNKEERQAYIDALEKALYVGKIISYTQGYMLMRSSANTLGWNLNYGGIALMWRGGCIIRSRFLGRIKEAFDKNPDLNNLMMDDYFMSEVKKNIKELRKVVSSSALNGIPMPSMFAALSFYDGYTTKTVSANLLQGQRDYFGAHTYKRIDKDPDVSFHTNWQ